METNIKKYAIIAIVIIVVIYGVFAFMPGGRPSEEPIEVPREDIVTEPEEEYVVLEPHNVVELFYNWYLGYEGNPLSDEAYKQSPYLSQELVLAVEEELMGFEFGGADPFICAQDKPERFSVELNRESLTPEYAEVNLDLYFFGNIKPVVLSLDGTSGEWIITQIDCSSEMIPESDLTGKETAVIYFANTEKLSPQQQNECGVVFGTERIIDSNRDYYEQALEELFKGPTSEEQAEGFESMFFEATSNALLGLKIENRAAYVNLADIRSLIPGANSSCGSQDFFAQVEETLKHKREIDYVIFAIQKNSELFYEWMQLGCTQENFFCDNVPFADM